MRLFSKRLAYILLGLFLSFTLSGVFITNNFSYAVTPAPETSLTQGVRKTVLDNGLTVLTKEVHTAPVVSVQVWYKVGSRNEKAGENGISHQLEHLMFKGTKDRPVQFGRLFSALGSQFNAFTTYDETAYFGTVEQDKLEALLTLEADRMENSLIGAEQLNSEKRVVISELQGYENSPGYRLNRAVMRSAFANRPYGLPVGGTKADVEKFTVEQVQNYYHNYYSPDNATLVITGDFATEPTLKVIQKTFGKLPKTRNENTGTRRRKDAVTQEKLPLSSSDTKKSPIVLKQPGSAALLQVVYPLPNVHHPDVAAIDVMDAVITGGRSSQLYQALVESGLASSISASPVELIEPGWYDISVTAAPGQELSKINQVLQTSLTKIQQQPVTTAELNRAKTLLKTSFILNNQDITSQANLLGLYQTVAGDYRYVERYLQAIAKVTPLDVQRVAKTYLNPGKQTIGFFEPTQPDGKSGTSNSGSGRTVENFSPGKPVDPAELAKYLPPATSTTTSQNQPLPEEFTLKNGLRVLLLRDRSVPTVNLSGNIDGGSEFDTNSQAGLANLVAANLMNGTQTQNALSIAQKLEDRGVGLNFNASREGVSINGNGLSANLPIMIQTLADVVQNATFPSDQLELSRDRALTSLKIQLDDPRGLGRRVFQQAIYPENHPFYSFPTEKSLKSISRQDLVKFYKEHYRPDATTIALVGDFDPARVKALLNKAFSKWQAQGKPVNISLPPVSLPKSTKRVNPVIPGKAEAVTYLGYNGISRKDPRFYPALVLNQILGGDTLSSRLGTEVRDRQGLTYGIYSAFAAGSQPGPFLIQMQTAPNDTQKAIASTIALLKQVREQGITEAELNTAKRSITNSYPVDLANPSDVADLILKNSVYGLSLAEIKEFPQQIDAVNMAQVKQVIKDLIHPENLVIVTAGPGGDQ
ncbi:MAG: insulinase family protein [Pelatocladus maniniholoensis HA4357-MV3]|jgi:zinc protease|uniref:Insulinase family protein n=1 Tax=Pelatocladus maniniholoensis HA4357-MV3 TaxID=1117104 RepID=A0A9E3LUX0_9NOST|nr:insulinase family protein [Pelatocladus maniniholoensis HA4357-MV3]BAZ67263.1 peptidase M16 domain-containing protein [Fischerella sp. NIES-4106]